jgi:hypothetical protein
MASLLLIGVGAGFVSALLFAVVISGSPLALVLSYVAPFPIIVAALGWNHRAGLVAAVTGAVGLALIFRLPAGLAFAAGIGLPAWWLGYLALLARQTESGPEWYPTGRLLAWIAVVAAAVTLAGALGIGFSHSAYEAAMRNAVRSFIRAEMELPDGEPLALPGGLAADDLVSTVIAAVPPLAAASFVLMLVLNVWLAAKTVAISERLPRPWPAIADTTLPRITLAAFVAAVAVAAIADGFLGLFGTAVTGALTCAFALQGLAALHAMTRGRAARPALLGAAYLLLILFLMWILPILAIFGMADILFGLRARWPRSAGRTP